MPSIDLVVKTPISKSSRVRQLEAMFDVPPAKVSQCRWRFNVPIEEKDWRVGLIVGPSGSGKSTVARELFGDRVDVLLDWQGKSVIDDFGKANSMEKIARVCQAVGFNTIPAWLRPFRVLSTGEKFRVELARRLLELDDPIVVDEFTSVVDRQVAKIGAHAVQKYIRRHKRQFVAVSCHYDIDEWLQPDWILEPATGKFARRSVQPRPALQCEICRVDRSTWKLFAPFHYLTANMHKACRCFVLLCEGRPASFAGVMHRVHFACKDIRGVSRAVTLPDWQGLGLAFHLMEGLGAAYSALGYRLHIYPAHPMFVRSCDRASNWKLLRRPGDFRPVGKTSSIVKRTGRWGILSGKRKTADRRDAIATSAQGMRPCATFVYRGPVMDRAEARRLLGATA